MVVVNYHDDLNEVQGDPVLAALLSAPYAAAPFDRIEWFEALASECGMQPLYAFAREGDAAVMLPLRRDADGLTALANWYSFRFKPVFLGRVDYRIDQHVMLLAAIARDLARQCKRVTLAGVPDEWGETEALERAFHLTGWTVFRSVSDVNHVLPVNGRSYADFLATRPGPLRTAVKRKAGKVDVSLHCNFDPQVFAEYSDIYAASWKPDEGSPAFLRRFAEEEGKAGRLRMAIARVDGRPVAAQLWTVEHGTAYIHKLAHREDARALSPGTVLSAALFEQVIDRDRVALVDFGTGDDAYKRDWMEQVRPRYRLDMLRAGSPRNWPRIARHVLRRLAGRG